VTMPAHQSRIHEVRIHNGQGGFEDLEYNPTAWYIIRDRVPKLDYKVSGPPLVPPEKTEAGRHSLSIVEGDWKNDDFIWQRWDLGNALSEERRTGSFELKLRHPSGLTLRCYVIPTRILGVNDMWSMIESVEAELDRPIAWDPNRGGTARAWVREGSLPYVPMVTLLLDVVEAEILLAQALRRDPPCELGIGNALTPVPECAIVSLWAARRGDELQQAQSRLDRDLEEYERRQTENSPQDRRDLLDRARQATERHAVRLRSLLPRVLGHVVLDDFNTSLAFGPLLQRDHRLRGLLRAFSPPTSRIVSEDESEWSRFPPITLNRLFECWGAVWIVQQIRRQGFVGHAELALGTDRVEGARWTLQKGNVRVVIDYEAQPSVISFDGLPAVYQRHEPAAEWVLSQHPIPSERPLFASGGRVTPDYVIRFEGPSGRVMAIGDATLADPKYHRDPKENKPAVVAAYRRSILWAVEGRVLSCEPLGGFVLFPGPEQMWNDLENQTRGYDVWFICPHPRDESDAAIRFADFFQRLLNKVS
jgi:hypothetical protein